MKHAAEQHWLGENIPKSLDPIMMTWYAPIVPTVVPLTSTEF